jgi:DNA-binding LytR/AlgR family response regulator
MQPLLRLASLLLASLFLLPIRPAEAGPPAMHWIDMEHVVACPAQADDTTPPDFAAADCRRMPLLAVDPQHATLWLKASIEIPPATLDEAAPLGLFVSGKAASTAWVNGHRIGGNGRPGIDAGSETPGRMDAVIPIPRNVLKAGANEIALKLSGHRGVIRLANPLHMLAIGAYADPADQILRAYWPSLVTAGVFLLGFLYFGVSALRGRDRTGSLLLSLMSLFAVGQLFAEASRGLFPYRYPLHDLRLSMIVLCSLGFGLCLAAHVIRRFKPTRPALAFAAVALPTLAAVVLVDSYDGKATFAMLIPVVSCALATGLRSWRREPGALAYVVSLVLFAALSFFLGGEFLNAMFFYLVAALLLFLFAQQASVLAHEQQLRIALSSRAQQLQAALDQAQARSQPSAQPQKIRIIDTGKIQLVPVDQITHCSGAGDYVELNFADGGQRLHSGSLNELEGELPPAFIRVHRSHIVNTAFVESLEREASGVGRLRVSTGAFVPVSRRIMPTVRRAIGSAEIPAR